MSEAASSHSKDNSLVMMADVGKMIDGSGATKESEILANLHKVQISLYEKLISNRIDKIVN